MAPGALGKGELDVAGLEPLVNSVGHAVRSLAPARGDPPRNRAGREKDQRPRHLAGLRNEMPRGVDARSVDFGDPGRPGGFQSELEDPHREPLTVDDPVHASVGERIRLPPQPPDKLAIDLARILELHLEVPPVRGRPFPAADARARDVPVGLEREHEELLAGGDSRERSPARQVIEVFFASSPTGPNRPAASSSRS